MIVTLTERERWLMSVFSKRRLGESDFFKGGPRDSTSKNPYSISGSLGELAACKALNRYPLFLSEIGADDAEGFEFRTTKHDNGCLLVYPMDRDHHIAVLVIDKSPIFELRGWIQVADAKRMFPLEERREGGAAYWVPQNALQEIHLLTETF